MATADCVICVGGRPNDVAAELPAIWVTIPPMTPLPGYVCLVATQHVREPFELPYAERRAFWDGVDRVASVLDAHLHPDKWNYEIHGNTIPHLHLHLYPRWRDDRFAGEAIDPRAAVPRTSEDRRSLAHALLDLWPNWDGLGGSGLPGPVRRPQTDRRA
jgi:diadenosine tetraphosphate (Ap4A) HIT family hydrolase